MEELLTRDFSQVPGLIWEIILDPASRPQAAVLVFGIIIIALAMLFLVVLLVVLRRTDDEEENDLELSVTPAVASPAQPSAPSRHVVRSVPRIRIPGGVVVLVAVVLWWFATAATTSNPAVCLSCHGDSAHATTQSASDPHKATACISCHEDGGPLARYTTEIPRRVQHIASGIVQDRPTGTYGHVGSNGCTRCHGAYIAQTWTDEAKGVKMSHVEPVKAGAQCLDCHQTRDGVLGTATTKMKPCLRCHNGTDAPAECSYCHVGDFALAVTGRSVPSTATAQRLVSNPQCGGCHAQETCDACHGLRMPHTPEFMQYAHARQGVEDLWYNGGKTCGKCHYEGHRACTTCHKGAFLSHGTKFRDRHGISGGSGAGCDSCHSAMAYRGDRKFCVDLCH